MTEHYPVIIIGGGINGAGVAQAVAARGHRCLLLEKNVIAGETSRKSSKLIHGGLRYLEHFDFGLVRESLKERNLLIRLAPELVRLEPFHIPVYVDTSRSPSTIRVGLSLYSLLAGMGPGSSFSTIPRASWDELDGLNTKGLKSVFRYYDAQTDDHKLTHAVLNSAVELGAEYECHAELKEGKVGPSGVELSYRKDGISKTVTADIVVNAAGPWAHSVMSCFDFEDVNHQPLPPVELVQGTHLVMKYNLNQGAYYMEAPVDGRAVFLLPWYGQSLLGTTEVTYPNPDHQPEPGQEELDYLLNVMGHYFPGADLTAEQSFAGHRVLPATEKGTFGRSRETIIEVNDANNPRLVTILGGKLTVYRKTAKKVIRQLQDHLPPTDKVVDTATISLQPVELP